MGSSFCQVVEAVEVFEKKYWVLFMNSVDNNSQDINTWLAYTRNLKPANIQMLVCDVFVMT